ncbi:kinase-like domain-containing protein [Xylariaceae sp. FL0662B]|nr:kinase-like domain-containing protein [Xylariaceae sp. FL0662B]
MGSTREAPSQELILWTIRQMRGLSDALDWLHEANCRHGDLKPENILFFSQLGRQGHLVISDAGLAKVHILSTTERRTSTGTKMGTRRYEPPEVYLGIHGQALSRAYDVWSMGCIFMEFLVWLLYGYDEFRELNRLEKFWEVDVEEPQSYITVGTYQRDQFRVAGRVKEWLDKLSGSSVEGTSLYELVQIIGSRLLVVHVGRENTETQRATAHELSSRMDDIYRRALREAERDVPMVSIPKTRHAQTLSPAHEAPKSSPRPLLPLPPKPLGSDYSLRRKADDVYSHRRTAEDAYSSRGTADNVYSRRK